MTPKDAGLVAALDYPLAVETVLAKKRALKRILLTEPGLVPKRVAVLGGSSTSEISEYIELFLLKSGFKPEIYQTSYGQYQNEILFETDRLIAFRPEIVYVHTTFRNIQRFPSLEAGSEEADEIAEEEAGRFRAIWNRAHDLFQCTIFQNNFELPDVRLLGNLDASAYGGRCHFVERLNQKFHELARGNRHLVINDIHYLSAWLGLQKWHDRALWYAYKYAMSLDGMIHTAFNLSNLINAVSGKSRKCLVLDLDNTLWGGIIGEVGPEGIKLGADTPEGEAFSELQRHAQNLKKRGILLAVTSKNAEENAKRGFGHPDSVLKLDDFGAFKANWEDKARNVSEVARELNIGLESLVFLDDHPAERARVREALPKVAVPEIGDKVESYLDALDKSGYFETVHLSQDDLKRSEYYARDKDRKSLQEQAVDFVSYLDSLQMKAEILPFSSLYLDRVTQLINKTNQFNLTTKRLGAADVQSMSADPKYVTFYVRLTDRFGDNGLISALIGRIEGTTLHIDIWVMSCRVIKRGVELALFDTLVKECQKRGLKRITGTYLPSAKNEMVKSLYPELGFQLAETQSEFSLFHYKIPKETVQLNRHIQVTAG